MPRSSPDSTSGRSPDSPDGQVQLTPRNGTRDARQHRFDEGGNGRRVTVDAKLIDGVTHGFLSASFLVPRESAGRPTCQGLEPTTGRTAGDRRFESFLTSRTTASRAQGNAEPPDVAVSTSLGPRAEEVRSWLLRLTTPRFVRLTIRRGSRCTLATTTSSRIAGRCRRLGRRP
jgi:hypothetical protein